MKVNFLYFQWLSYSREVSADLSLLAGSGVDFSPILFTDIFMHWENDFFLMRGTKYTTTSYNDFIFESGGLVYYLWFRIMTSSSRVAVWFIIYGSPGKTPDRMWSVGMLVLSKITSFSFHNLMSISVNF